MLAIARRAGGRFEPIFVSLAQAVDIIQSYGFHAEYIPSYTMTSSNLAAWDEWLGIELCQLCRIYSPSLLVYDGNNPSPGILAPKLNGLLSRAVWIRQGLMPDSPSPFLRHATYFDLMVEPGELAGASDTGPTVALRSRSYVSDPIRLYDRSEYLSSMDAKKALGIGQGTKAILIQIGMGSNRDISSLIDVILNSIRSLGDIFVGLLEWSNSANKIYVYLPDVQAIRGHSISPYLNAFDLCISAAGYNSFHELIDARLPTIFVPNTHPTMDRQITRAAFAQESNAAITWDFSNLEISKLLVRRMLEGDVYANLVTSMETMSTSNGAGAVAEKIALLAGGKRFEPRNANTAITDEIIYYSRNGESTELHKLRQLVSLQYGLLRLQRHVPSERPVIEIGPLAGDAAKVPDVARDYTIEGETLPVGLIPSTGLACADLAPRSRVTIFDLFGVAEDKVDQLLELVEGQQQREMDFIPVFVTSDPRIARFTQRGYVAEYLDTSCGPETRKSKLAFLVKKWSAQSVVDLTGKPSQSTDQGAIGL